MLTVGSVLTTNVSQISLCQLLSRATHKVRLDSCLSLLLEWTLNFLSIHFGAVKVVHSKSSDKHEIDDKFLKLNFLV